MNDRRRQAARTTATATAACLLVALAGCGTEQSSSDTAATTSAASATASTSASASSTAASTCTSSPASSSDTDAGGAITTAAKAFLATLSDEQKSAVQFAFDNTEQRQRWSNLPEGLYERDGLKWGDLSDSSRTAWLALMQATMSAEGYAQVRQEWAADDALAATGDAGPGNASFGSDYYWVALIGEPSTTSAWQWQWGGHHVTVNATVRGSELSLTPSFIGAQPTSYEADGSTVAPLQASLDTAFALLSSLNDEQRTAAVLGDSAIDLVLGPGEDGRTIESEGVAGADLTSDQQETLLRLAGCFGNLENGEDATERMAQLKADLATTYFAWYGPTDASDNAYFRVTGPHIVAEFSHQSMGGDPADHVHGVYRDPTDDYGASFKAGL